MVMMRARLQAFCELRRTTTRSRCLTSHQDPDYAKLMTLIDHRVLMIALRNHLGSHLHFQGAQRVVVGREEEEEHDESGDYGA